MSGVVGVAVIPCVLMTDITWPIAGAPIHQISAAHQPARISVRVLVGQSIM
jgi:hypothetical protein